MAVKQNLRGGTEKIYEITNAFNKGYNTSVADDLLNESYFRDINNMFPAEEGNLTKRPGISKIGLYDFFVNLDSYCEQYDVTLNHQVGRITELGVPDISSGGVATYEFQTERITDLEPLVNRVFKRQKWNNRLDVLTTHTVYQNKIDTLMNFIVTEDNRNILQNKEKIVDIFEDDSLWKNSFSESNYTEGDLTTLTFIMAFRDKTDTYVFFGDDYDFDQPELYPSNKVKNTESHTATFVKVCVILSGTSSKVLTIRYDIATDPYFYNDDDANIALYSDYYYLSNAYNALIKIKGTHDFASYDENEGYDNIEFIQQNVYKPTAIEVKNIGFNILADKPMEYIDTQGTANSIRGVFYTYEDEPVQIVPYNKPFKIHILSSGSGTNGIPEYRPNNGEIDTSLNPYTKLPGSYNEDKSIFECTGINETENMELKIVKGSGDSADTFYAYFSTGSVVQSEIGKVADIADLVFSSKHCKFINNQLVLYGGHGYIFFSDFDNFTYFPNYYYLYVAESENEEVTGISYFRQYYAVFTNKRIKRMTGAFGSDNFGLFSLNDFVGSESPLSIKQVSNYLYFLSNNGLYMLKQGYTGEGTENVDQIDLPIYRSYDPSNITKGLTFMNYYALFSKDGEVLLYNYVVDAYYKFKLANVKASTDDVNITYYSAPFQYNKMPSTLFYGITETVNEEEQMFDICKQDFVYDDMNITDNGVSFVSSAETSFMSFGSPTNIKKFKSVFIKLYNKYGKNIPLYVTIIVDDKTVVSPDQYVVSYDEQTNTYYYNEITESNKNLKGHEPLGTLTLGEDILGGKTVQVLKMKVSAKGRGIKVIVSDGINEGKKGYSVHQNNFRFDLATIGVVYKLKKVKEV